MKPYPAFTTLLAALGLTCLTPAATALEATEKVAVCAGCHGANGHSAVPDNPILAGQHADYLDKALQAYANGKRKNGIMKTMAERLSEQDKADIIAYYAAQPPHESQAQAVGDAARGAGKVATCVACHGSSGRSENPLFPKLAGQHAVYLSKALTAYRSGERSSSLMLSILTQVLSDEDIADIAAFFAAQNTQPANEENAQ